MDLGAIGLSPEQAQALIDSLDEQRRVRVQSIWDNHPANPKNQ